jgi:uncharacterized membrane protein
VVSLVGLVLNFTSMGITFASSLFGVFFVVLVFIILAYLRRNKLPLDKRFYLQVYPVLDQPQDSPFANRVFVVSLGVSIIVAAIALGYVIMTPSTGEIYTEFYILDQNRTITSYPTDIDVNATARVVVGIISHELDITSYTVLTSIGTPLATIPQNDWDQVFTLNNSFGMSRIVQLHDQDTFEDDFTFRFLTPGQYHITWRLLLENEPSDYELHLWVDVHAP